ncbi:immunoglobulin I-set domain-containing protein [Loa loa]|uniref:Immunoglobulin I-set domain-containing protein n=2 Tax=Loa loa TaxID=7209 RepID=A0A1S0U9L6_LOALO|nr:immunoglobulin I-set domain-containing protein [Loa loa]EFO27330.2 immunoglobulin I-set domain-containing protein [Loa loa]
MLVALLTTIVLQWLHLAYGVVQNFFQGRTEKSERVTWRRCTPEMFCSSVTIGKLAGHEGRYSYVTHSPDEKHLKIENVTLRDDGLFECQMIHPSLGAYRTSASVNVLVPPEKVIIMDIDPGSVINVVEGNDYNLSCLAVNGKPHALINWYIYGTKIDDSVKRWTEMNTNRTVTAFATLFWKPRRSDTGAVLTCEALHPSTSTHFKVNITPNVLYPSEMPKIDILSQPGLIKPGDNITMKCSVVGGNPPPRLLWFLHGNLIGSNYTYDESAEETVNIYSIIVDANDNGAVYECQSTNLADDEPLSEGIRLSVSYAPRSVEISGETTTRIGRIVAVQCRTGLSNPAARISWLINGQTVQSVNHSYLEQATGTVTVSNLSIIPTDINVIKHQINVQCTAINDEGTTSKQLIIRIFSPPMKPIIYGSEGMALREGETLNLTCESQGGNPLATLTWFRGIEKLRGTRNAVSGDISQSVVSVLLDRTMNNQQLKCEATNGALDEPLVVTKTFVVLFPPRRVTVRQDDRSKRLIVAGEITKLFCLVHSSNPVAQLMWTFPVVSSELLFEEKRNNRSNQEYGGHEVESVIEFIPTEEMDGGEVQCTASHPQWVEQKVAIYPLNVLYAPRMVVNGPLTIVIGEGDDFRENLTLRANPPVSTWRWRKDGSHFEHGVGAITARGPILSGRSVTRFDSGLFTLIAGNGVGTVNVTVHVIVEYAAYVTHITSPVMASAGEEVVMECEVDGVPKRDGMVKWLHGEQIIEGVSLVGQTRAVMRLNASFETNGAYTCLADNGKGVANRTVAYLLVNRAPAIVRQPSLLRAAGPLGGRVQLRCRANAVPDAHFQWIVPGQLSPIRRNSSKYSFTTLQLNYSTFEGVFYISSLDRYDYQHPVKCFAINRYGEDTVEIRVSPPTAPDTPVSLRVSNITKNSLSFNWIPGFDGGSEQIFEVRYQTSMENVYHIINSSFPEVEIRGLEPACLYEISIRARNKRGMVSEFSRPPIIVYTKDEYGMDVVSVTKKDSFPVPVIVVFGVCCVILLLINCFLLCYMHRRKQKRKMQEKTEMVRNANNSGADVRLVQMYGALTNVESPCRPDSTNTNRSELGHEPDSEDDRSLRTMIEVSPNGYVQQVDPVNYYERECLVEYEFDPNLYGGVIKSSTLRGSSHNYVNLRCPKASESSDTAVNFASGDSLSLMDVNDGSPRRIHKPRIIDTNSSTNLLANNTTPQMLSTFLHRGGIHTTPFNFAHIDGDLV